MARKYHKTNIKIKQKDDYNKYHRKYRALQRGRR